MRRVLLTCAVAALAIGPGCAGELNFELIERAGAAEEEPAQFVPKGTEFIPTAPTAPERKEQYARTNAALSSEDALRYMRTLAPLVVSRGLSAQEVAALEARGGLAIRPMLVDWTEEDGFAEAMGQMMSTKLATSGTRDGVDFDVPGRLVAHIARHGAPAREIITAPYCVDADDQQVPCDTGAPYTAGVLTTRAFMTSNASRFNLHRASILMKLFACRGYPMDRTIQPPLEHDTLIPMFRADTPEEQTVAEAANGFGNGFGCYTCHSQFGAHAQLFVRFDDQGVWREDATGIQDPAGELGRSTGGLMASHHAEPADAASEHSQIFGVEVDDLTGAASVIADHELFLSCTSRNILEWSLSMTESDAKLLPDAMLTDIAELASDATPNPSLGALSVEALAHPSVISSVLD